jgi:mannose-1-phosphate guanylyltransferase
MPKQLLTLFEGQSLLQMAFARAVTVVDPSRVLICAGRSYVDVIAEQLPGVSPRNLLGEPEGRDSLAAVAWSVATIASRDPEAVVAVLSADHVIEPVESFSRALRRAFDTAADDVLVTFGVTPTHPHTGFGYLHVGEPVLARDATYHVREFAEKPALDVAERYLAEGDWLWNSGMFCWKASVFLDVLKSLCPDMAEPIERLVAHPELLDEIYPSLPKTSVDYAIMEPQSRSLTAPEIVAVELDANWADVGSFPALADQLRAGADNVAEGETILLDSSGTLVLNRTPGHLVVVAGVEDMIVVHSGNVTLVCPSGKAESIKEFVELARERGEQYV